VIPVFLFAFLNITEYYTVFAELLLEPEDVAAWQLEWISLSLLK